MRRRRIVTLVLLVLFGAACADAGPGPIAPDDDRAQFHHGKGPHAPGGPGGGGGGAEPPGCQSTTLVMDEVTSAYSGERDRAGETWNYYAAESGELRLGGDLHTVRAADVYILRIHNGQYRVELDVEVDEGTLYLLRGNNRARGDQINLDIGFRVGAGDGGESHGSTGIFAEAVGESVHVMGTIELAGENRSARWSLGGGITICADEE